MVKTITHKDKTGRWKFDSARGDRVIGFFSDMLCLVEGELAGQPFVLQDWQKELFSNAFGWVDSETGLRKYRRVYLELAKKNGKTSLAAGLSLYLAFADQEPGAKVYFAAGSKDQADIGYDLAKNMVEKNHILNDDLKAYKKSIWKIGNEGNYVKSLSKQVATKHGLNLHGLVYDELHAAPNRDLHDTLYRGTSARRQPMTFGITTAGFGVPGNLGWELHNEALAVIKGDIENERLLPVIYAADKADDPFSVDTWKKANPNLFIVGGKSLDYMEDEASKARRSKSDLGSFKRLDLNIWTSEHSDQIPIEEWDECKIDKPLSWEELAEYKCWAGLDLSKSRDFTSLVLRFEIEENKHYFVPFFWVPTHNLQQRPATALITEWIRQEYAVGCKGKAIDYDLIYNKIVWCYENLNMQKVYYDPHNANYLVKRLEENKGIEMEEARQGYQTISPLYKNWEIIVVKNQASHDGNPVMGWQLSNMILKQDENANYRPDKKAALDTIDGPIAMLMSLKGYVFDREEEKKQPGIRIMNLDE